ncbi:hypothetical protein C2862_12675 [Massilia sp. Mn16-1_5]|nr:hypothetical protein C2862_12675 [Massilia sp. Mn16-1_5]
MSRSAGRLSSHGSCCGYGCSSCSCSCSCFYYGCSYGSCSCACSASVCYHRTHAQVPYSSSYA